MLAKPGSGVGSSGGCKTRERMLAFLLPFHSRQEVEIHPVSCLTSGVKLLGVKSWAWLFCSPTMILTRSLNIKSDGIVREFILSAWILYSAWKINHSRF